MLGGFCAYWGGASTLLRGETRLFIWCGSVGAGGVSRMAPFALFPVDFVEEWAEMRWEEASGLVSPGVREGARLVT